MKIKNPEHPYAPKHVNEWRYLNATWKTRRENLSPGSGLLLHKRRFEGDPESKPNFRGCFRAHRDIFEGDRIFINGWSRKEKGQLYITISLWDSISLREPREKVHQRYLKRRDKRKAKKAKELALKKEREQRAAPRELRRTDTI